MPFHYKTAGLQLKSDCALAAPQFDQPTGAAQIDLELLRAKSPIKTEAAHCYHTWSNPADQNIRLRFIREDNGICLRYSADTVFRLPPKNKAAVITYQKANEMPEDFFGHLFLDQVLPLYLSSTAQLILHAAVVEYKGVAVGLLGKSGSGKSTISQLLLQLPEVKLISDDTLIFDPQLKRALRTHSTIRVISEGNQLKATVQLPAEKFSAESATPCAAIICLQRDAELTAPKLSRTEPLLAITEILPEVICLGVDQRDAQQQILRSLGRLTTEVNIFSLLFSDLTLASKSYLRSLLEKVSP